jgi:stearoyl-CoA desaturase (delta-9 desaturase)
MKQILKNIISFINLWCGVIPIHILGVYSIYSLFVNYTEYWWAYYIVGFICIKIIGVSAGYHRLFSHKSFSVNRMTKWMILWFGNLSGQGSPIQWATIHRSYHHRYSDQERDPHSPHHGFWHSYIWWMFKLEEGQYNTKHILDLLKDKDCVFFHKHYAKIFLISHCLFLLIDFNLWLYAIILPAFITYQVFNIQTSVTHIKKLGYRNTETKDDSVNIIWIWPITLGESWHNNHHSDPTNINYGKRWWEIDPTYWVIKLLRSN